jgi:hypothetical protein
MSRPTDRMPASQYRVVTESSPLGSRGHSRSKNRIIAIEIATRATVSSR